MRQKQFKKICVENNVDPQETIKEVGVIRILRDMKSGTEQEKSLVNYIKSTQIEKSTQNRHGLTY
jgi:hypothetical protein